MRLMTRTRESGSALVFALFIIAAIAVAVAMMNSRVKNSQQTEQIRLYSAQARNSNRAGLSLASALLQSNIITVNPTSLAGNPPDMTANPSADRIVTGKQIGRAHV